MSEKVEFELKLEGPDETFDRVGYYSLETDNGWMIFLRPHLSLYLTSEWRWKVADLHPQKSALDIFRHGLGDGLRVGAQLAAVAVVFSADYFWKLHEAGFKIYWDALQKTKLNDGRTAGPGATVYMTRTVEQGGRKIERLDKDCREAIELGNAMNFCNNGIRVSVRKLDYGIVSGGRMYEVVTSDEKLVIGKDVDLENDINSIKRSADRQKHMMEAYVESEQDLRASPAFQKLDETAQRCMIGDLRDQFGLSREGI